MLFKPIFGFRKKFKRLHCLTLMKTILKAPDYKAPYYFVESLTSLLFSRIKSVLYLLLYKENRVSAIF